MDEIGLTKDMAEASHAQRLLEDEMLVAGFDKLEAEYLKAWRETGVRDTDGRERLWQAINLLGKVKDHLRMIIANGRLAQKTINEIARTRGRPRS